MPYRPPELMSDIEQHLARVGSKHWRQVMERHHVSSATFWRAVRAVKACGVSIDSSCVLSEWGPADELEASMGYVPRPDDEEHRQGGAASRINFQAAYRSLWEDLDLLRSYSLNPDSTIKNPAAFDRALRARLKALSQALRLEQQIYSIGNVQSFVDAILSELANESPELRRRIIARVEAMRLSQNGTPRR